MASHTNVAAVIAQGLCAVVDAGLSLLASPSRDSVPIEERDRVLDVLCRAIDAAVDVSTALPMCREWLDKDTVAVWRSRLGGLLPSAVVYDIAMDPDDQHLIHVVS